MPGPAPPPGEPARQQGRRRGDAVAVLAGRVFAHTRPCDATEVAGLVGAEGGLVLTGARPVRAARRCREEYGFTGPILYDLAAAESGVADRDEPFDGTGDRLLEVPLEQRLQGQIDAGADAALTPTRYLRAGDLGAVEAAIRGVDRLGRDDVILSLPLDAGWLAPGLIDKLIDVLSGVRIPKAVMPGGQFDPPQRVMDGVLGLRRMVAEVPDVALFRTDLAGLDAVARGCLAASIGTSGSLRHIVPPGAAPLYGGRDEAGEDRSPSVLVPDLLTYVRGSVLADRFGERPAPICRCAWCGGRSIAGFLRQEDWKDARLHGVAVWSAWVRNILYPDSVEGRRRYWRQLCRDAIAAHARYDALIRSPEPAFVPPAPLWAWAGDDTSPAATSPAAPARPR